VAESQIVQVLNRHRRIALDTCVLVYYLERSERFHAVADAVISRVCQGRNEAVLSTLALLETLVGPYRRQADSVAETYYAALSQLPHCQWAPLTYAIADRAAQLRGSHNLTTPDAIHVATAIESSAELFVTNDADLPEVPGIRYLQLIHFSPEG